MYQSAIRVVKGKSLDFQLQSDHFFKCYSSGACNFDTYVSHYIFFFHCIFSKMNVWITLINSYNV